WLSMIQLSGVGIPSGYAASSHRRLGTFFMVRSDPGRKRSRFFLRNIRASQRRSRSVISSKKSVLGNPRLSRSVPASAGAPELQRASPRFDGVDLIAHVRSPRERHLDTSALCQEPTYALQRRHRYSMISSARADRVGGTSMPSALAFLRLTAK